MFDFNRSVVILERAPDVFRALAGPLPDELLHANEGPGTWSPYQVLQHLLWCEVDDWVPRLRILLEHGEGRPFDDFDREGGFTRYAGWSAGRVIDELARLRADNLATVRDLVPDASLMDRPGRHPALGPVTLSQLLATWVTHDLAHVNQITRVLVRHHGPHVGPWRQFISLLSSAPA